MRPARGIMARSTSREPTASRIRSKGDVIRSRWRARSASRSASSRSAKRFSRAKEICERRFAAFGRIDLAVAQPLAQRFGRDVDEDHLVGERQDSVGQRFPDDRSGQPQDRVAQAFEMLDVERRYHVDAGAQNGQHVVEAFWRDRTGRVACARARRSTRLEAFAR